MTSPPAFGPDISKKKTGPVHSEEILVLDGILMATAEKALLDAAYLRHKIPFADELEKDLVDVGRLTRLTLKYPASVQRMVRNFTEGFEEEDFASRSPRLKGLKQRNLWP